MMPPEKERRLFRINFPATDVTALVTDVDTLLRATDYTDPKFKPLYTACLRLSSATPTDKTHRLLRSNLTSTDVNALVTALDTLLRATEYTDPTFKPLYSAWLKLSEAKPYKS